MKAPKKTWKDFFNSPECAEAIFFALGYTLLIRYINPITTLTFRVTLSLCYALTLMTYLSNKLDIQEKVKRLNSKFKDIGQYFHQKKVTKLNYTNLIKPNEHLSFNRKKHIIFEEKPKKTSLINYHQYIPEGNLENFRDTVEKLHRSKWTCPISYELLDIPIFMEGDNNARGIICLSSFQHDQYYSNTKIKQILAIKDPQTQESELKAFVDKLFRSQFKKPLYIPQCNVEAKKIRFAYDHAQTLNADLEEFSKTKSIKNDHIDYIHKRLCVDNVPLAENNIINFDPLNIKDETIIESTKAQIQKQFPHLICPISNTLPNSPCTIFHRKKTYPTVYDYHALLEYYKTYNKAPNKEFYTLNCSTLIASSFKGPKTYPDAPILISPAIQTSIEIQKMVYFLQKDIENTYLDEETLETYTLKRYASPRV